MKIIGVIPARYESTRLPGKLLKDICGKPMIWWVYTHAKESKKLDGVYVATDSDLIKKYCDDAGIDCIMTKEHADHLSRLCEVSTIIDADVYVSINGDEPLLKGETIDSAIREIMILDQPCVYGTMRELTVPAETIDTANVKLAITHDNQCLYLSRLPIPSPHGSLSYCYKKYVGIICCNKLAMEAYAHTYPGPLSISEDIAELRFLENGIPMYFTEIESDSISVDTKKDLEKVRSMMSLS